MLVAIPLFERFTALDAVGPYEVLQRVPSIGVVFVGHQRGEVRSDNGMPGMMVDKTFGELTQPDVVDWVREAARSTWRSGWWSHLPQRIITAAARRQAFLPGPRCPDLLVPRHVRIHRMLVFPRPPHGDHGSPDFLGRWSLGALRKWLGVALEDDQRGCAGRMCCGEQRSRRERADAREEDRFATVEIVEHRGDAVGPLLQGRQRARRDGVGPSGARLVEED